MTAPSGAAVDPDRRRALVAAKLAGLVAGRWGAGPTRRAGAIGASATLVEPLAGESSAGDGGATGAGDAPSGIRGWVLPDGAADRALGPALAWADRQQVTDLHLVADVAGDPAAPGALARQATWFTDPPTVWAVDGTDLVAAEPAPVPTPPEAPAPAELVDLLIDAGLEIVVEGGIVRGEVNGLEVARIVHGHTTAGEPIDEPRLEVGVGKADRELTAAVHSGLPAVAQLGRVVEIVRGHRQPGEPRHPLNQLVPDRWLRAVLCRAPQTIGLAALRPAEGARPRPNLAERDIALAAGEALDGTPVVVACSVGIALDLVPVAADARAVVDARAPAGRAPSRLVLAVPERDDHPSVRRLAARLRAPATVAPVPGDWRTVA